MLKIIKRIITRKNKDGTLDIDVSDNKVNAIRRTLYDLIFALAISLKVSPTRLANALNSDKIHKYARAFNDRLIKKMQKNNDIVQEELDNIK